MGETHGEQAHSKMLLIDYADGRSTLITGSANYSRRNLDDFNLEADIAVYGNNTADVFIDAGSTACYCGIIPNGRCSASITRKYADHS